MQERRKEHRHIKRLAIFASGAGSNLAHIHREIVGGRLPGAELALVVSNNSRCGAMEFARSNGIPAHHLSLFVSGDEGRFQRDVTRVIEETEIEIIALAGYLKKLPDALVDRYQYKILNVHPALLPSFGGSAMYGIRVHEAVLARGCKVSGATVHFVTSEYDTGPIVLQKCCRVDENDTPETLQHRVRKIEFELFPQAIELLANERLAIENNRVHIIS